jgi:hypothetical protein
MEWTNECIARRAGRWRISKKHQTDTTTALYNQHVPLRKITSHRDPQRRPRLCLCLHGHSFGESAPVRARARTCVRPAVGRHSLCMKQRPLPARARCAAAVMQVAPAQALQVDGRDYVGLQRRRERLEGCPLRASAVPLAFQNICNAVGAVFSSLRADAAHEELLVSTCFFGAGGCAGWCVASWPLVAAVDRARSAR